MGKTKKGKQTQTQKQKQKGAQNQGKTETPVKSQWDLLKTIGDLNVKENWDKYYTRKSQKTIEHHAEWSQIKNYLTEKLMLWSSESEKPPEQLRILVPACGNSKLSEHMYAAGFEDITNVDFSQVLIKNMLDSGPPGMKWLVMDITKMTFENGEFDAVVDKGGLDNLMESKGGTIGPLYVSEVRRVLKCGGMFFCVTLLNSYIAEMLFTEFRFGWKMSIHTIDQSDTASTTRADMKNVFLVVAEKNHPTAMTDVSTLEFYLTDFHGHQADALNTVIEKEKKIRAEYAKGKDAWYTLADLKNGVRGNLAMYEPGRRIKINLDGEHVRPIRHRGILLDTKKDSGYFKYHYLVYLVPKVKERGWLHATEEGQWRMAENAKTARMFLVFLNRNVTDKVAWPGLTPAANQLSPGYCHEIQAPRVSVMVADTAVKLKFVHKATSDDSSIVMVVEEFTHEYSPEHKFRSVSLLKNDTMMQYEALLSSEVEVSHNFLVSQYHNGVIAGMMLMNYYFNLCDESQEGIVLSKAVVLGLGAGLLPMFMKMSFPSLKIEVAEADPIFLDVTREHFGFKEDERLKVHTTNEIEFLKELAYSEAGGKVDVIVVDVPSFNTSSGLNSPGERYLEESFLFAAKKALSEHGLLVFNLISKPASVRDQVHSCLNSSFTNLLRLKLLEDENEVLFVLKTDDWFQKDRLFDARDALYEFLKPVADAWSLSVSQLAGSIEYLPLDPDKEERYFLNV